MNTPQTISLQPTEAGALLYHAVFRVIGMAGTSAADVRALLTQHAAAIPPPQLRLILQVILDEWWTAPRDCDRKDWKAAAGHLVNVLSGEADGVSLPLRDVEIISQLGIGQPVRPALPEVRNGD